jgi:hypothetical protein
MAIEILDEWNERIGTCCCNMPACPAPTRECEHLSGQVRLAYNVRVGPSGSYVWWQETRFDYTGGGYQRFYATQIFDAYWFLGGFTIDPVSMSDNLVETVPPLTGSSSESKVDEIDPAVSSSLGLAALAGAVDWTSAGVLTGPSQCDFGSYRLSRDPQVPHAEALVVEEILYNRFRWIIPDDFPGTYFKITWDVIEEPEGWDDETPTVFRSFVDEDLTWEWEGPGDPEDPDSWISPWFEIDPPAPLDFLEVNRRIVNIRYECYRSQFGQKPQITGEAVTLPDP